MEQSAKSNLRAETIKIQNDLVEYCRSNNDGNVQGTRQDRLPNYRRLIHTIIWEALSDAYPITRSILTSVQWDELVDDFISNHRSAEPQLYKMPFSLIAFVKNNDYQKRFSIPYLIDLLTFEWVEIEVHTMQDQELLSFNPQGDFMSTNLVFNPYQRILTLNYPIHQLRTMDISMNAGSYFYNVYRQPNGTVQYMELNAFTRNLIQQFMLHSAEYNINEILLTLLKDLSLEMKVSITDEVFKFCLLLKEKGLILGTRD